MWITPLVTGMPDPMPRPAADPAPAPPAADLPARPDLPPAVPPPGEEPPGTPDDQPDPAAPDLEERLNALLEAMDLAVRVHVVETPGHLLEQVRVRIRLRAHDQHRPHGRGHGHHHGRHALFRVDAGEVTRDLVTPGIPVPPGDAEPAAESATGLDARA